jgi:hypothetical protein
VNKLLLALELIGHILLGSVRRQLTHANQRARSSLGWVGHALLVMVGLVVGMVGGAGGA